MKFKQYSSLFTTCALFTSTITSLLISLPTSAQRFPSESQPYPSQPSQPQPYPSQSQPPRLLVPNDVTIPAGTRIPVRYNQEKILVTKEEKAPLTLEVAANIRDTQQRLLIPAGSQIVGEIQPGNGGSQFVAKELIIGNNPPVLISANSGIVSRVEEVNRGMDVGAIARNAAIGAAAAAVLASVTGNRSISIGEILGGAGIGAASGAIFNRRKAELISIDPNRDLDLTLASGLLVAVIP